MSWFRRLKRIPGIQADELTALTPHYEDQDALQLVLDSEDGGIENVAAATNLPATRVAELLGASLHQSACPLTRGWVASHWADLLFVAILVLLAMLPRLGANADGSRKSEIRATRARIQAGIHAVPGR